MFKKGQITRDANGNVYEICSMGTLYGFYRCRDIKSGSVQAGHASSLKLIGNNFKFKGAK